MQAKPARDVLGPFVVTGVQPEVVTPALPPVPRLELTPPESWAFGVSFDLTGHLWWGGSVGLNLEVTDLGLGLYVYHPLPRPGSMEGFGFGSSVLLNYAEGSGAWTRSFYNIGGNAGPLSGGIFSSDPFTMSPSSGWSGGSLGLGVGAPAGLFTNETYYHRPFLLPY